MKYQSAYKKHFLLILGWMFCLNSLAQEFVNVSLEIHIDCPDRTDPRLNLKDIEFEFYNYSNDIYYGNNKYRTFDNYGCQFVKDMANKFRVVAKPKPGTESSILPYIIREIHLVQLGEDNRTEVGKPVLTYMVQKKDFTVDINLPALQTGAKYYKLQVFIERCQDAGAEKETTVKVMAYIANRPSDIKEDHLFSVSDMHVEIGDKIVAFDEEGVGFLKIKPGQYKITYSRFLSKAGDVLLKSTKTGKQDLLPSTLRYTSINVIECIVPLLQENTNSGNLYDYELKIIMLKDPPDCGNICQLAIVSFKPDVVIHREGAPDEEWIPAEKGMVLHQGDEISCDPDGVATLRFAGGSTVDLKNATQLKIASYFTDGGIDRVEILMKMGEVAAKVNKSEATKSDFVIKGPNAGGGVRGTIFYMRYEPPLQLTTFWVDEGKVQVTPSNTQLKPVMLIAGQQVQVGNNFIGEITGITANKPTATTKPAPAPVTTKPTTIPTTPTTPTSRNAPAWSRGEQLLSVSFDEAMKRAEAALLTEGYVNLQKQANIVTGYKGVHTAIILCNDAPNNKQWINIIVSSLSADGNVPGAERVKLQKQMDVIEVFNSVQNTPVSLPVKAKSIDWYANPADLGLRGKNNQRFSFTCPAMDYLGHRLYGTDIFTDDSSICTAGVHAGAMTTSGGTVTIEILPQQDAYSSSNRNGIHSDGYGYWPGSFRIVK